MLKISFTNAEVSDHGYGLEVNGKSLEDIISTALGTTVRMELMIDGGTNPQQREAIIKQAFDEVCDNIEKTISEME